MDLRPAEGDAASREQIETTENASAEVATVRAFRAIYKDRRGKHRESSKWYVEFRDPGHLGACA